MALNTPDGPNDFFEGLNDTAHQQGSTRTRIDFTRSDLPKPWWFQSNKLLETLRQKHETEVASLERLAGRRLNQTEYEAVAYWSCKEAQIRSRGVPLGILLDRAYATREQNRFPFWRPRESFDFNSIKIGSRKIVEGQIARTFWNSARYFAYSLVAGPFFMMIFTGSWAISTANIGRIRDPRTKQVMVEIFRKAQEERAQRLQQNVPQNANRDIHQRTQSSSPISDDTGSPVNNMYNESTLQDDPYSPQSLQNSSDFTNYGTTNSSTNSTPFSPTSRKQQPSRPAYTSTNSTDRESNESSQFFDDDYDDASPTATYPSSSSSRGGAWDKIRAGSSTTSSAPSKQRSTSNTSQADYRPPADVDTRSQAQKDFDESVERERQGRNFD